MGVEATYNFLWLGATPGSFHPDKQDNVYIQLTGEAELLVYPPNCSSLIAAGASPERAPFFHMRMRPGDGAVIPSGAHHKVVSGDLQRIALNSWFEPKFGRMQWSST